MKRACRCYVLSLRPFLDPRRAMVLSGTHSNPLLESREGQNSIADRRATRQQPKKRQEPFRSVLLSHASGGAGHSDESWAGTWVEFQTRVLLVPWLTDSVLSYIAIGHTKSPGWAQDLSCSAQSNDSRCIIVSVFGATFIRVHFLFGIIRTQCGLHAQPLHRCSGTGRRRHHLIFAGQPSDAHLLVRPVSRIIHLQRIAQEYRFAAFP